MSAGDGPKRRTCSAAFFLGRRPLARSCRQPGADGASQYPENPKSDKDCPHPPPGPEIPLCAPARSRIMPRGTINRQPDQSHRPSQPASHAHPSGRLTHLPCTSPIPTPPPARSGWQFTGASRAAATDQREKPRPPLTQFPGLSRRPTSSGTRCQKFSDATGDADRKGGNMLCDAKVGETRIC